MLSIAINGDFRAYPLRLLLWHEIVNDTVGGVPVLVGYCPLCNSGVVFERRLEGRVLEFGNTGRLRHLDMVRYDKESESWWRRFLGEALIGEFTGKRLKLLAARLESFSRFKARAPGGKLLVPDAAAARPYGRTPYVGMDSRALPRARFPYALPPAWRRWPGSCQEALAGAGWALDRLRREKRVEYDGLVLTWGPGRNPIHDRPEIAAGRDVGKVVVQRRTATGLGDTAYDVSLAFAFSAVVSDGVPQRQ